MSVIEAGDRLRDGTLTALALTEHALARIAVLDGGISAFVTVTADRALADAARADRELAEGRDRGPLHGIPHALKDIIDTAGIRTTAHSRLWRDRVPDADATVAARLRHAGAVLLGKLATYEFATVGPDAGLPFPPARNPRHPEHITGGSSSGSAAAIAAGFARIALGTDTGGSIRAPAGYCGVVGLKPTWGRVSRHGVAPLSPSLDHVGPLAATVAEAALLLDAIAGFDPADPATDRPDDAAAASGLGRGVHGLRLAYPRHFHAGAEPDIARALDAAVQDLARLGAIVEEIELPDPARLEACGTVILEAEAFAEHRDRLAARIGDYGRLAARGLLAGARHSGGDLEAAHRARRALTDMVLRRLDPFDAMIVANTLTAAPRVDSFDGETPRWTPMRTLAFNVTGQPALAVPIGVDRAGLPLGMQIVGKPGAEAMVCRVGAAYEAVRKEPP